MRSLSILLALCLGWVTAASGLPARAAPFDCAASPRCVDIRVPVPPNLSVAENGVRILLPKDYEPARELGYPVLYLLHGAGETHTWARWDRELPDLLHLTREFDLIVVMPDSGGDEDDPAAEPPGWYTNWSDGSWQWERYHIKVLIPYIDANFNTAGDQRRGVAGISMGGYGAMKYAARHPGVFEVAASVSGAVDIRLGEVVGPFVLDPGGRMWGHPVTDRENWRAHNPTDLAARLAGTKLLISTGNGVPDPADLATDPGPCPAACVALEHGVWHMNLSFIRALDAAGVPHTDNFQLGDHHWPSFYSQMAWAFPRIATKLGAR